MALLAPVVEIELDGVWTDITAYTASVRDAVRITRGRQDEQSAAQASTASFSLNNVDGRFSPRNPSGPYYGAIGRNTPVRISVAGYGYRFHGEISAWPTVWDFSGNDAWTRVQAAGITRRLSQGIPPLEGPITRFVTSEDAPAAHAYWGLEDPEGSTSMASGLAGGTAMVIEGASTPTLAANTDFVTSSALPVLNNGSFRGVPIAYAGTSWYSYFLLSVPDAGDTNDTTLLRLLTTGSAYRWELRLFSDGTLVVRCFDNAGASLLTSSAGFALNGAPSIVEFNAVQDGSDVDWECTVTDFDSGVESSLTGTLAGRTAGVVQQVQFNSDRAAVSTAVGHFTLLSAPPAVDVVDVLRGYAGETAGRRIERLCDEEGIPLTSVGDLDATEVMGSQTAGALLALLAECEAADLGYLHEPRDAYGLAYRTRESLYAQAAAAELAYTDIGGLEPVEDDQRTRNDVTVSRERGSSARYQADTGPLSVLSPPDGVGRYRESVPPLNVESDDQLAGHAEWRVTIGTIDEPRYPVVAVDLHKLAGAAKTAAVSVDVADLVTIDGTPVWVPAGGISALALGYTETIAPASWVVEFNCIPASPYDDVLKLDDDDLGRLDSETTTLAEDLDTTETGVDYTGDTWITTATHPAEFPFSIVIGGEEMAVTSAVAGTFTVTRSVNGVVKSHLAGAEIRLARPARLAL